MVECGYITAPMSSGVCIHNEQQLIDRHLADAIYRDACIVADLCFLLWTIKICKISINVFQMIATSALENYDASKFYSRT